MIVRFDRVELARGGISDDRQNVHGSAAVPFRSFVWIYFKHNRRTALQKLSESLAIAQINCN